MGSIPVDSTNGIIMEQHNHCYKSFTLSLKIISILKRCTCTFVTIALYPNMVAIIDWGRPPSPYTGPIYTREWWDFPLALTSKQVFSHFPTMPNQ